MIKIGWGNRDIYIAHERQRYACLDLDILAFLDLVARCYEDYLLSDRISCEKYELIR